jgi:phospholipase/carboxylesterase
VTPCAGFGQQTSTWYSAAAPIAKDEWRPLMKARAGLPVLQSHGRSDPVLSYAIAEMLRQELTQAGLQVEFIPFNGGHGIPNGAVDGLARLVTRATT